MNTKGVGMFGIFALVILSGFVVMGLAMLWGDLGNTYGVATSNATAVTFSKIDEANEEYRDLQNAFVNQTSSDFFSSAVTIISTGVWTVVKSFISSVDFIIGGDGLVSSFLMGLNIPFPPWFVTGAMALVGLAVFFIMIRRGTG